MTLLLLRTAGRWCALPVDRVVEVMRPRPIETLPDAPPFVLGTSLVRGEPVPVVDLGILFEGRPTADPGRLITVRLSGRRRVGLLADQAVGLRRVGDDDVATLPPLLDACEAPLVERLLQVDGELLSVLELGKVVPEASWALLEGGSE